MMEKDGLMFGVVAAMTDARRAARKLSLIKVWKRFIRDLNEKLYSLLSGNRHFLAFAQLSLKSASA
jgi:hypothetical protein